MSFHLVSGAAASSSAWAHWAREKARAEQALFELAKGTGLGVIAYRPGAVIPSGDRARWYHRSLLVPLQLGVESATLGRAMLEVTDRGPDVPSGVILENRDIIRYSNSLLTP